VRISKSEKLLDEAAGLLIDAHELLIQADPLTRAAKARELAEGAIRAINWAEFVKSDHYKGRKQARRRQRR
jgi:hypothetical protein